MHRKKWMRKNVIAGMTALAVLTSAVRMSGMNVSAAENVQLKEEVVYVVTGADGTVESVNVVNIFGKGDVTDYGDYSAVKMLNATDAISLENGVVTFTTEKEKVYYQGTLENAQIPWEISMKYCLDGKEISPDELAGKSGQLDIALKVEKNDACKGEFYEDYALQVNMTLSTQNCENISAEGATIANVGADKQISYTVLPGKGLEAEVTADVRDFEMDAIAINGIKLDLDIEVDDEELMDKVTEIMNAARDLDDGAAAVSDGTGELRDGGSSLTDGAASMDDGLNTLDAGIRELNDGVKAMQSALNNLNAQSGTLTGGSAQMLAALQTLQSEPSSVSVATDQLAQLTQSSAAIRQGIRNSHDGAAALQASLSYEKYMALLKEAGLDLTQLQAGNTAAIQTLTAQINELSAAMEQIKSIPGYESDETCMGQLAQLEAQVASLNNIVTLLGGSNVAILGTAQYFEAVQGGATELVNGLAQLDGSYEQFDAAIANLVNSISGIADNVGALKAGVNQLVESYGSLNGGINSYTGGVGSIVSAYSQIVTATEALVEGSGKLTEGSASLRQGTADLYDGIISLDDGAKELSDGTKEFHEKTDGMDSEIENKIDDMLNTISRSDAEIRSFVSEKNTNVESVQFVIKTGAIEKPEVVQTVEDETQQLSLWEKFLRLFGR